MNNTDRNLAPRDKATGTDPMSKSMSAGQVIKTYILTVMEQPDSGIPDQITQAAPNFVSHLKMAKGNGDHFVSSIEPMISQDVANILAFSNQWKNFGPYFIQYGKKGQWDVVKSGLQMIQMKMDTYMNHTKATATELQNFTKLISADTSAFSSDYTKLTSATSGIPAEIDALNKKIKAQNRLISTATAEIAGGAAATLAGGLMVVGGLATEALSFGATTALVVSGVLVAGGGIALITLGSIQIDKASHDIANTQARITELNENMGLLSAYSGTLEQLKTACEDGTTAISNLQTTWEYLYEDMNAVIHDIDAANSSIQLPWFEPSINTAVDDWTQLNQMAALAQSNIADMQLTKVSMKDNYGSLLNALPKEDADKIRQAEVQDVKSRHAKAA